MPFFRPSHRTPLRRIALKFPVTFPVVTSKTPFTASMLWISMFLAGTMLTGCQPKPQSQEPKWQPAQGVAQPVEKFGVTVVSGPMDSILLKDYAPDSSLVVPETKVAKAKFPAIDVHAHVYAETGRGGGLGERWTTWESGNVIPRMRPARSSTDWLTSTKPLRRKTVLGHCGDSGASGAERAVRELGAARKGPWRWHPDKGWGYNGSSSSAA
jgi:hypothetical protein